MENNIQFKNKLIHQIFLNLTSQFWKVRVTADQNVADFTYEAPLLKVTGNKQLNRRPSKCRLDHFQFWKGPEIWNILLQIHIIHSILAGLDVASPPWISSPPSAGTELGRLTWLMSRVCRDWLNVEPLQNRSTGLCWRSFPERQKLFGKLACQGLWLGVKVFI